MDVQWPLPIGIYEKIHAGPRDVYWLGPLPFSSRAGILVPDYAPRPFPDSAIQPGVITVPLAASKLFGNNPFTTSLSHRVVPHPLKFVEQHTNSHSSQHVFPSDALRSLYRLAERVYSNPLDKHTRPVDARQPRSQPAVPPSRDGSVHAPPSVAIFDRHSLNASSSLNAPSVADSTASLYTMNASTLAGDDNASTYWHQAEDIKATIRDFAASVSAWGASSKDSASDLEGVHFNPISVSKEDEPWKHELLRVLNAYRDSVENNTALHSDASRLRDELEKSRGQIASLRKELKNETASADAQASELTRTFEYERRYREQTEADVASLQTEVAHLKSQLKAATKQLEEGHLREQTIQARYETLSATFQDVRAQLFEPEWVAKLRAELREDLTGFGTGLRSAIAESQDCTISSTEQIMGSLKNFSNHTHSSFNHVSQELRHQRDEVAQLRERNSQLVVSNENLVHSTASTKERLDTLVTLNQETRSAVTTISSTVEEKLPSLETSIHQSGQAVRVAVADIDAKLDQIARSTDSLADMSNAMHNGAQHRTRNHADVTSSLAENKILLQALSDKVQEHIASSTQTYAAIPTRSSDGDEAGPATVAVDALRAQLTTSLTGIREALDQARIDIQTLVAHSSSHGDRHDLVAKHAEVTNTRFEQLDIFLRQKESSESAIYAETRSQLVNIESTLSTITAATWLQQAFTDSKVTTQEDLSQIHATLRDVLAQVDELNSRKDDGLSQSIAEVTTQLSEVSLKLSEMESALQGTATTSDLVEELSTVKAAHSHEHQASTAVVERVRSAVESLEEYTRSAIDQVNAALDEQQSRLVTIQTHTKQHSEDYKALSSSVVEGNSVLKELESHTHSSSSASSTSLQSILNALEELKASLSTFEASRANDTEALRDAPASSDALVNLQLILKEQGEVLRSLPQAILDQSSDRHDKLSSRTVEIVTLLTGLAAASEYSSKEIGELKDAIAKLDSEVSGGHSRATEGLKTSETAITSVSQSIQTLSQEISDVRNQISTSISSREVSTHVDERLDALLVELKLKTDAVTGTIVEAKDALANDIAQIRQRSENDAQSLTAAIDRVSSKPDSVPSVDLTPLEALIERQNTDISNLQSHLSKAQAAGLFDIKNQIEDLRGVVLDTTLAEVLESLRALGISVTEIRSLIAEESKTSSSSATALSSVEVMLQSQVAQFTQILRAHETHDKQHNSTLELLERNYSRIVDLQSGVESRFTTSNDLVSNNHEAVTSKLDQTLAVFNAHTSAYEEKSSELLRALNTLQVALELKGDSHAAESKARIDNIFQGIVELRKLVETYSSSSTSVQQDVKQLGEYHSALNVSIDQRFSATMVALTSGFESLRQEVGKNPEQFNSLLVSIQAYINNLQEALERSLKGEFESIHKEIEPLNITLTSWQAQPRIRLSGEGNELSDEHTGLEDQLLRMEHLRHSMEGLMINHHCNGCNCRGYDSNVSSPAKPRRALSQIGSDATGVSPHPYIQQAFDVPSLKDVKHDRGSEEVAKGYSIDLGTSLEEADAHSTIAAGHTETVDLTGKKDHDQLKFPRPSSPSGTSRSGTRTSSGLQASGSGDHHHHDHDREISNPFELFSRRPRKSSQKPSEDPDESHDAGPRPKMKSSTVGSGKGQRGSLLASALLSTVSDNTVPTTSRHRTTSGGLHRLSSIFGKHHHHDDGHSGTGNKSLEDVAKAKGSTQDLAESKKYQGHKDGSA